MQQFIDMAKQQNGTVVATPSIGATVAKLF
jgi:hypothetical protein